MKPTDPLGNHPATQFCLSCKDSINPALKRKPVLDVVKRGIIRGMTFAPQDQMRFGMELQKVSRLASRKAEKAKEKGVAEKERDGEMLPKEIGKETKRALPEKARYLANFTALATDTASGETTASIAIRERRGARGKQTQLSSSRAKIRKPRKI